MSRKRKGLLAALVSAIVALNGGYYYCSSVHVAAQISGEPRVQTAAVRRSDLASSASGAGTVIPATELELGGC